MNFTQRALTGVGSFALASAVTLGTAASSEASTVGSLQVAAATAEFQCGPNNWIGALVPENPPGGANFHSACVKHDACYSPGSRTSRLTCDTNFRNNMYAACAAAGKGSVCRGIANLYYWAVRGAGSYFYKGSGANN